MYYYYPNAVFSFFAFLGLVLVLLCLPSHLQARNTGACMYIIWTALASLNLFINSVVWNNSVRNYAPLWCDISTKIIIGYTVVIPATSLCISRRLYAIMSGRAMDMDTAKRRRALIEDLLIGVGIPVLQMALHYISQGHRFDIVEDVGCYPTLYNTWVAYVLHYSWPPILGLVSAVYCVLSLRAIFKISSALSNLNLGQSSLRLYWRLIALTIVYTLFTIPLALWIISTNIGTVRPWISWEDTHFDFYRIKYLPSLIWKQGTGNGGLTIVDANRWFVVGSAFLFVLILGTSREVWEINYAIVCLLARKMTFKRDEERIRVKSVIPERVRRIPRSDLQSRIIDIAAPPPAAVVSTKEVDRDLEKGVPPDSPSLPVPPAYSSLYTPTPRPVRLLPPLPIGPKQ